MSRFLFGLASLLNNPCENWVSPFYCGVSFFGGLGAASSGKRSICGQVLSFTGGAALSCYPPSNNEGSGRLFFSLSILSTSLIVGKRVVVRGDTFVELSPNMIG